MQYIMRYTNKYSVYLLTQRGAAATFVDVPAATTSSMSSVGSSSDDSCCVDASRTTPGRTVGIGGASSPAYQTTHVAADSGAPSSSLNADAAAGGPVHHVLAPGSPAHGPGRHCLLWACKACKKKNMNVDRRKVRQELIRR